MPDLDQLADRELSWVPSRAVKRAYDLRAGDAFLGTLAWKRGTLAAADRGAYYWTFKREGFWHLRVTVRVAGSETDLALFTSSRAWSRTAKAPNHQGYPCSSSPAIPSDRSRAAWDEQGAGSCDSSRQISQTRRSPDR